ncbi:outer membrane lipoprotein carrier protein LolA [Microbispora rosea]|uniref:outer membrane lipoprotein carrier protein LolA n=1 Tax=Microbispora rosea TaxID=58117 RepID=UPI0037A4147A
MAKRTRAVRWGVPVAAVAVVAAAVGTGPVIAAVRSDPSLPDRTAEQLLADIARTWQNGRMPQMSGTIVETASLGLPALPGLSGLSGPGGPSGASPASLLSGSHQLKIWYAGEDRFRLMLPGEMSETDLVADGGTVWLWDSAANKATRLTVPAAPEGGHGGGHGGAFPMRPGAASPFASPFATPEQAARQALQAAGTDTAISVGDVVTVAGRAAYQIVLTPKSADSLIKDVRVALDGEKLMPLRVQVYAKGAAEPVFEVGFESLSFTAPAPENFSFTPPPGAKVEQGTATPPADHRPEALAEAHDRGRVVGSGWDSVLVTSLPDVPAQDVPAQQQDGKGRDGMDVTALLDGLKGAATPVSGEWGSGRLLRTKVVSILVTDDGRLLAGAVAPEALYRAAGVKG